MNECLLTFLYHCFERRSQRTAASPFLSLSLQAHVVFEQIMPSVEPYPSGCQWSKHYITQSVHHISHIVWLGAAWNASPALSFPPALRWSKCFQGQSFKLQKPPAKVVWDKLHSISRVHPELSAPAHLSWTKIFSSKPLSKRKISEM